MKFQTTFRDAEYQILFAAASRLKDMLPKVTRRLRLSRKAAKKKRCHMLAEREAEYHEYIQVFKQTHNMYNVLTIQYISRIWTAQIAESIECLSFKQ